MPTTNSAYGTGNNDNYCNENSKLNPISKYAIDKVQVEEELLILKMLLAAFSHCFWNVSKDEVRFIS